MTSEPRRYRIERPAEVNAFLARAGAFLERLEAENNLLFGICSSLRTAPEAFTETPRFAVAAAGPETVAAALQTPPYNLVLAAGSASEAIDRLAEALADEPLPGVTGPAAAAARFAERWVVLTGQPIRRGMAERIFRLTAVRPPRPTSGHMRFAEARDRELIIAWLKAFTEEALDEPAVDPEGTVDRWIARVGRALYLWEDGGEAVSLTGVGGRTPNGIRVGPVYTPPSLRGRGYASNLVAEASQAQLDGGRQFVFLFTDLANPTSNRIYQAIGYEPVIDVDLYRFGD